MKFEVFIANRYLRAKRKQTEISIITVISVLGVAAGSVAGLLVNYVLAQRYVFIERPEEQDHG